MQRLQQTQTENIWIEKLTKNDQIIFIVARNLWPVGVIHIHLYHHYQAHYQLHYDPNIKNTY